ncbi:MAG TPA: hypothetical protein VFJ58_25530 [Armatimonadota bacterium]|nr:hypothetical protein [Armatimonadota bacterium]
MRIEYTLAPIAPSDLAQIDLVKRLSDLGPDEAVEAYQLRFRGARDPGGDVPGEVLFLPDEGRVGVAWGGEVIWTDASSLEEGMDRYLDHDIPEDNPTSEGPSLTFS